MKCKLLFLGCLLCYLLLICTGCTITENTPETSRCVKCGGTATTTLSGPADIIQKNGISLNDCEQITSNIYTAPICDSCLGPVAKDPADIY